ncbi:MAG TPA: multidrug effflux MFS transporter [Propionibacteriaceae bacterium]|nr:multidrug effflux MFS transporter [Propionibacteriaceae bacterium]
MTSLAEPALETARPHEPAPAARFVGRRYVQLVVVLGALMAIGPLTIDTYLPALPQLSEEMGATDAQAQLTITGLLLGLGLGQLIIGPLSDTVGRRRPLLVGLAAHGVMSLLCALAPSIGLLSVTRTLQGVAGAAVSVVVMAIVRDLFTGVRAAQLLSRLMLVLGVAPILAPSLGSALLTITSWRGIFVLLAVTAIGLWVLAWRALPETLPTARRRPATVRGSLQSYGRLFTDRTFLVMVAVAGLAFATLFAYIAGGPFILQGRFGLSPQEFGIAFSANAAGMILMTQLNPVLVARFGPVRVMSVAVLIALSGGVALLVANLTGLGGLAGFLVPVAVILSAAGLTVPNAPAIALSRHGEVAGTAAALLGAAQFLVGGSIAPLVGALDDGSGVAMAAIMVGTTGLAATAFWSARRRLIAESQAVDQNQSLTHA